VKAKPLHSIFSILLAFLVLFSTLSFTVESHYCGKRLVDTAIFTQVKGCGMEMPSNVTNTKGCCKHEVEVIKGQDELKFSAFDDLSISQQLFLTAFTYSYVNGFESLPKQIIPHKDYSPPNLIVDIQLLDEAFLI